jgi:hypothetical protein
MVKQFLITRPRHDKHTTYLYSFSKAIVTLAKKMDGLHLSELSGSKANRKNLTNVLKSKSKTLVFLNGHGDEETVYGHNDKPILDSKNSYLTKDRIVYCLACASLMNLGKTCVNEGAKAYVGYKDDFMWVGDPSRSASPDKDKNSVPFRRVCHVLIYSLLTGINVSKSIEKTKNEYRKLIRTYGNSEDDPHGDAPAIGFALAWDMLALDMVGNVNVSF